MWHEYEALEIRIGEQNGRERGLGEVSFWEQNPCRFFAGYTTVGEGQEKEYWKAIGYLNVRFIAT